MRARFGPGSPGSRSRARPPCPSTRSRRCGSPSRSGLRFRTERSSRAGAAVFVSEGVGGPSIPGTAEGNGSVALYVPTTLPLTAGSYCVRASALGFASTTTCNLSPSALSALSQLVTSLDPVPVTLTVLGLPGGQFRSGKPHGGEPHRRQPHAFRWTRLLVHARPR